MTSAEVLSENPTCLIKRTFQSEPTFCKRRRFIGQFIDVNSTNFNDDDSHLLPTMSPITSSTASSQPSSNVRDLKRKRLQEICEGSREQVEQQVSTNINVELLSQKRRKFLRKSTTKPACTTCSQQNIKNFDEETVRAMIGVALETQKQSLLDLFVEEHVLFIDHHQQQHTTNDTDFSYVS